MGIKRQTAISGCKVQVMIDGKAIGGQQTANLSLTNSVIEITNQIDASWTRSIPGVKSWKVVCGGFVIEDEEAFIALMEAFDNNSLVELVLSSLGEKGKIGKAYITQFPINASYQGGAQYNIQFTGSGDLSTILD